MGEFLDRVQTDKIAGPLRRAFTPISWKNAFDAHHEQDERDKSLYQAGLAIHEKLGSIRARLKISSSPDLSPTTKLRAFVAAANHNYLVASEQSTAAIAELGKQRAQQEPDGFRIEELAAVKLALPGGVAWSPNEIVESTIDGVEIPVRFTLSRSPDLSGNPRMDQVKWEDISLELNLGIFYRHAEDLWDDCLWNDYKLISEDDFKAFIPTTVNANAAYSMGLARRLSLSMGFTVIATRHYRTQVAIGHISQNREVVAIGRRGRNQYLKLAKPSDLSNMQERLVIARALAAEPYYAEILDEPRPSLGGLSVNTLLTAWGVLAQAAKLLMDTVAKASTYGIDAESPTHVWLPRYAPVLQISALADSISSVTSATHSQAMSIVEFLTFRGKTGQEIWAQPLVPVGVSTVAPVFGAAVVPNLRRLIDVWLRQLDFDLSLRGPAFEAHLRSSVQQAITNSSILSARAWCLRDDYTFKPSEGRKEQIDLLLVIGSTVVVAEAKCILEPTEAKSIAMHRRTVQGAAEQARRKSQALLDHRSEFVADMRKRGFDLEANFEVVPLVVVSTTTHVGVSADGVPVVDEYIIDRYLNGELDDVAIFGTELAIQKTLKTVFFSTAEEAQERAAEYFKAPPQLQRFHDGLKGRLIPLYAIGEHDWRGAMLTWECIPSERPLAGEASVNV